MVKRKQPAKKEGDGSAAGIGGSARAKEVLKGSEQNYRLLAAYHKQLNDISISFSEAVDTHDLFHRIAETLRLLTGAVASSFSAFEQETRELKVVSLSIDPVKQDRVSSVFGPDMLGMRIPVSADDMKEMFSQGIRRPRDLHELSSGLIPQDLSDALMDAAGCQQIVALAITHATELIGTCIAYLSADQPVVPDEALKTYIYLSGLAIKRRKTQDMLRRKEHDLRESQRIAHVGSWRLDVATNQVFWTEELYNMYGLDPSAPPPPYTEHMKLFTPESWERLSTALDHTRDTGIPYTLELENVRKDGGKGWMLVWGEADVDSAGKTVGLWGAAQDITERKETDEKLRESEERFRRLSENAPDVIFRYRLKPARRFEYISPAVVKLSGYEPEEYYADPSLARKIVHPADRNLYEQHFRSMDASGKPLVLRYLHKAGHVTWAEEIDVPVYDVNGQLIAYEGIVRDVTERKRSEEAVRESERRFKGIIEHITDIFFMLDTNREMLYISPQAEQVLGYTIEEVRNNWRNYMTDNPVNLAGYEKTTKAFTNGKKQEPYLQEFMHRDGTKRLVEINESPLKNDKGEVTGIVGAIRDVTERKQVEDALKESEEKYRIVVENAMEAIIISVDGMIKFANSRAAKMSGYSQEELTSVSFTKFVHPDDRQMVTNYYLMHLQGTDVPTKYSFRIICKPGDIKWVDVTGALITWKGKPAILNFLNDITDRRRLEEEQQRVEKLESVGLLAGGIAHDFNNILTAILGNISLASMEAQEGSELHGSLEEAQKAVLRAKDLTKQLLTFSRGGAPVMQLSSLTELLKDTSGFALHGSNVKCNFSIPADLWHAEIDTGQVSQVIHNLVINAQQAMPEGGTIELTAENIALSEKRRLGKGLPLKKGNYIRIAVADHGSGIPAQHMDRIFDPFFTTKQKGSGLGLATSFSIARQHGGHLSVESEPGCGSTFYLYLPASRAKSTPRRDNKIEFKPAGKARILVMDDEKGVREVAGRMLKHAGYKDVEFAADGAEAIKLYKAAMESGNPFSVAILDLTIAGGMGGKETVRKLLKIDPGVKAIVSSGYADDPVIARYKEYGFSGMVAKPYTLEELRKALQGVIG